MTEKRYCGQCSHLINKGIQKGLPIWYCPIIEREVSFVGYTCPMFNERVITDDTDLELVEMQRRVFE